MLFPIGWPRPRARTPRQRGAERAHRGSVVLVYHPRDVTVSTGLCHELAALARLSLTGAEAELYAGQLGGILQYLQQLQEVDIEGVDAMTLHDAAVLRADLPGPVVDRDLALSSAPAARAGHVVVPKFKED